MKKTLYILDGDPGNGFGALSKPFEKSDDYECTLLDDLYNYPEKLVLLKEANPDFLFLGTTGMRPEESEVLREAFKKLVYIPKAVIFATDRTAEFYCGIAREFKELGTIFYENIEFDFNKPELQKIGWI